MAVCENPFEDMPECVCHVEDEDCLVYAWVDRHPKCDPVHDRVVEAS